MQGDISSRTSAGSSFTNALSRMKTRDCSTWVFMQNLPNKQKKCCFATPFLSNISYFCTSFEQISNKKQLFYS